MMPGGLALYRTCARKQSTTDVIIYLFSYSMHAPVLYNYTKYSRRLDIRIRGAATPHTCTVVHAASRAPGPLASCSR